MKNKKKKGFTLVELLAVIVILAVILVIAIPQIMNTIKTARLSSIKDSAMLIAEQAEKDFLAQQVLNKDYNSTSIPCTDVAKLNDDYASCNITYNNGIATVKLKGKDGGKFSGITCEGTKDNMNCKEKKAIVLGQPADKDDAVDYITVQYNEITTRTKMPVDFAGRKTSKWYYTEEEATPANAELVDIDQKYSNYIAYQSELEDADMFFMGVESPSLIYFYIKNNEDDTETNAVYLAALMQQVSEKTYYVAKWDGNKYVKQSLDSNIAAVTEFTEIVITPKTMQIAVQENTNSTYVPTDSLTAVEGMNWDEWLKSDYNTTDFDYDSTWVYSSEGDPLYSNQTIVDGGSYIFRPILCFVAGTKVKTETGLKNIENIQKGEKVYTVNLDTNMTELKEVTQTVTHKAKEIVQIKIGEKIIEATPRHEFYVVDKGWVRARDLKEGDILFGDEERKIDEIEHKYYNNEDNIDVYNLTVDGNHNYLITEYQLLVHNIASPIAPIKVNVGD